MFAIVAVLIVLIFDFVLVFRVFKLAGPDAASSTANTWTKPSVDGPCQKLIKWLVSIFAHELYLPESVSNSSAELDVVTAVFIYNDLLRDFLSKA